jgi:hypothetical protein
MKRIDVSNTTARPTPRPRFEQASAYAAFHLAEPTADDWRRDNVIANPPASSMPRVFGRPKHRRPRAKDVDPIGFGRQACCAAQHRLSLHDLFHPPM